MKNKYELNFLLSSHQGSFKYKNELVNSNVCGCFYCKKKFRTNEIKEWIEEGNDVETAICPNCGIDSVLSEKYPISDYLFLNEMHKHWF